MDRDAVSVPFDGVAGEVGKLGHPETGVEERPDNQALVERLARLGEPLVCTRRPCRILRRITTKCLIP